MLYISSPSHTLIISHTYLIKQAHLSCSTVSLQNTPLTLGFRHKIDSHFAASPHKQSRAEFMLITSATPIEKKGHFTREVVGAAAAWEAMKVCPEFGQC
jgi:hypothetical protein